MRHQKIHPRYVRNRKALVATSASLAVLISLFVILDLPGAFSHEADIHEFDGSVSDIRYSVALQDETLMVYLDGLDSVESEEDLARLDRMSVRLEALADSMPEYADHLRENMTFQLCDADGQVLATASPELTPLTDANLSADGNIKSIVTFSAQLTKDQFNAWTSYRIITHQMPNMCCLPVSETLAPVASAKTALASFEEEGHRVIERKAQERGEAQKAAREAALAAEAATIAAGNIPTRSSYDGDYSDTLMIGDSIMVLTSFATKPALPGVTIDASSGRSLETGGPNEGSGPGDGVLDHVRNCDRSFERYVIGTGNNDGYGMSVEDAEEIISCLDGKQIWFVTEYVSNNRTGTANTNAAIDEVCAKYPNVNKIDWFSLVSSHTEWLAGDNCHPQTEEGREAYATIVKNALDV